MGTPFHLTCLIRNLYAGQEATELDMEQKDWFKIGKGVRQGCILSPCLFNLYGEYIRQNARPHEVQAGIKIAGKNINNLRYADDTTLMAESEENLKSFLMNVKEESEKAGLKLSLQKTKIMASGPITCCPNSLGASDENEDRTWIWCNGSWDLQFLLGWGAESTLSPAFIPNCRLQDFLRSYLSKDTCCVSHS